MVSQTRWFERRFNFDFPVGLFPAIAERLLGTAARLEEMTRGRSKSLLIHQLEGKWSVQQHAGHLVDLEELHNGRIDDFHAGLERLRAADLKNTRTELADHNTSAIADILARFRGDRQRFVARLSECDEERLSRSAIHPRLNLPMRLVDMAYFVAEHDDHHLASIRRIISISAQR